MWTLRLLGVFVMVTVCWILFLILVLQFSPDERHRDLKIKDLFWVSAIMGVVAMAACALGILSK